MDAMDKEIEKIVYLMEIKKEKFVFSKEVLPAHQKRMDDVPNSIYKDYDYKKFFNLKHPEGNDVKNEIEDLKNIEVDKKKVEKLDDVQGSFEKLLKKEGVKSPSDLLKELIKTSGSVILKLKYHYNRPRPFQWAKENDPWPDIATVEPLVEQQIDWRNHVLPGGKCAGLASRLRRTGIIMDITTHAARASLRKFCECLFELF